jgi:hypothetical protein
MANEKSRVFNLVKDLLIEHDMQIQKESDFGDYKDNFFVMDIGIISTNEEKRHVCISFYVSTIPEHAVYLALLLTKIKDIKIYVGDSFTFDDDGKYIDGEEAIALYESQVAKKITDKFMREQEAKFILATSNGFKC